MARAKRGQGSGAGDQGGASDPDCGAKSLGRDYPSQKTPPIGLRVYPVGQDLRDAGKVAVAVLDFCRAQFPDIPYAIVYDALGQVRDQYIRLAASPAAGDPEFHARVNGIRARMRAQG